MVFDRSKFKATSLDAVHKQDEEIELLTGSSSFYQIEPGKNTFRIFPKFGDAISYVYPRFTHWLWVEREYNGTKEKKKVPIPDARHHGGAEDDIVEIYIRKMTAKIQAKKFSAKKLEELSKTIKFYQTSIYGKATNVCYVKKKTASGWGDPRLLEFGKSVKNQLNNLSIQEDANEVLSYDPFSDIDDGRAILIKYDPNEKKAQDVYKVNILLPECPIEDSEMEILLGKEDLEKLYGKNTFTFQNYKDEVEGLHNYDKDNEIGIFEDEDFLDEVEKWHNYWELRSKTDPKEELEEELDEELEVEIEVKTKKGDEFDDMDRIELRKFIKSEELDIPVFKSMSDDDIRNAIRSQFKSGPDEELEPELEPELEEELDEVQDMFSEMDRGELRKFIKENSLGIKVYKTTTDDELRETIRKAIDDQVEKTSIREEIEEKSEKDNFPEDKKESFSKEDAKKKLAAMRSDKIKD